MSDPATMTKAELVRYVGNLKSMIANLQKQLLKREVATHNALVTLGWTPPKD